MITQKLTPIVTGVPLVDEFFTELDRRIEGEDSTHPQASKDRLRLMRALLVEAVEKNPKGFEKAITETYDKFGVTTEFFAQFKKQPWA